MDRRLIKVFLILFALSCVFLAAPALAERTGDGIVYEISGGAATVVSYDGAGGEVVIPSTLGGAPVTAIGSQAFKNNENLTKVSMPASLKSIGEEAFRDCDHLAVADIPSGVTSIGVRAFSGCGVLLRADVPAGVTTLKEHAFYYCTSMTGVTLHEGLQVMESGVFYGCSSLTAIDIPSTVRSMYVYGFCGCSSLTSVTLPDGLDRITSYLFADCSSLSSVSIPDSVTEICDCAFQRCYALKSIELPDKVTYLPIDVFYQCTSLAKIKLPAKLEGVNNWAFYQCTSLKYVVMPKNVTKLYYASFDDWTVMYVYKGSTSVSPCRKYWTTKELSFSLDKSAGTVNMGGTLQLNASSVCPPGQDEVVYASSDPSVATVSQAGAVTGVKAGKATISAHLRFAPSLKASCVVTVANRAEAPIEAITLNLGAITIGQGQTVKTVTASVRPENADASSLVWTSSDTAVAKVVKAGTIKGIGKGTATITVRSGNSDAAAQFTVTVVAKGKGVTAVRFKSSSVKLRQGLTKKLSVRFSPKSPADQAVVYRSTNESVATVDANGKVTAVGVGSAKIIVTASSGVQAKCKVVVTSNYVTKISPSSSKISIVLKSGETFGKTAQISCSLSPKDPLDASLTYSSSDESVCSVDENGLVTSIGFGTATIVARASDGGGAKAKIKVTVSPKLVKSLSITGGAKMKPGDQQTLTVTVKPGNAYNQEIKWVSSDEAVASVDENGVVTAHKKGTVTITAKARDGSKVKATFKIKVK